MEEEAQRISRPFWVLDTNVFVSAAITPDGVCAELIRRAVDGQFTLAWDNRVLREYRDVLQRPRFRLSPETLQQLLTALPQAGLHVGARKSFGLPDPSDEIFLAVALATPDRVLITGNPKHFPIVTMKRLEVTILTPRDALNRLSSGGPLKKDP